MRALLLGASGRLGRELVRETPASLEVLPLTHCELDITQPDEVARSIKHTEPDLIVNAAAYTHVDRAETEQDAAFAVNAVGPAVVGRAAGAAGAAVIHFSTDCVFDGASRKPYGETDPTTPINVYGRSKLEGERQLAQSGAAALIIRTQWLFGPQGSFANRMWERALAGRATTVVSDQTGRPTYAGDLARATWRLAEILLQGRLKSRIVHVASAGQATWYDVARRVFDAANRSDLLQPCTTEEFGATARRPAWSLLNTRLYEEIVGEGLPHWERRLDLLFTQLKAGSR